MQIVDRNYYLASNLSTFLHECKIKCQHNRNWSWRKRSKLPLYNVILYLFALEEIHIFEGMCNETAFIRRPSAGTGAATRRDASIARLGGRVSLLPIDCPSCRQARNRLKGLNRSAFEDEIVDEKTFSQMIALVCTYDCRPILGLIQKGMCGCDLRILRGTTDSPKRRITGTRPTC